MDEQVYIQCLIDLHVGLERQGPGDIAFSRALLDCLPTFQQPPRIADLGCGAGIATLMLIDVFKNRVKAVDFSQDFLDQLMEQAATLGVEHLIEPLCADMSQLDWPEHSLDLIWSEGAAYAIGFETALQHWRPLLAEGGIAVISEMTLFTDNEEAAMLETVQGIYPEIKTESQNQALIEDGGYRLLETSRLPSQAWWDFYYNPLMGNIEKFRGNGDSNMQQVIADTESEMDFFRDNGDHCGYSFFVMQRV